MVRIPSPTRRNAGRLLVIIGVAAALPLTASHAIAYIDVPKTAAPLARALPAMTAAPMMAAQIAATAPLRVQGERPAAAPVVRVDSDADMIINGDFVTIDGVRKRWDELTPAEFARVRKAVTKARTALANTHLDEAALMRDLANLPDQGRVDKMQSELSRAQATLAESQRRMDADAAEARASGRAPDQLEAAIRARLAALSNVDLGSASRALATIDRQKVLSQVANAQQSMDQARAQLEQIQARIDADPRR